MITISFIYLFICWFIDLFIFYLFFSLPGPFIKNLSWSYQQICRSPCHCGGRGEYFIISLTPFTVSRIYVLQSTIRAVIKFKSNWPPLRWIVLVQFSHDILRAHQTYSAVAVVMGYSAYWQSWLPCHLSAFRHGTRKASSYFLSYVS